MHVCMYTYNQILALLNYDIILDIWKTKTIIERKLDLSICQIKERSAKFLSTSNISISPG